MFFMSLSRQKSRSVKRKRMQLKMNPPCPECGAEEMLKRKGNTKLLDGTIIKQLERYVCPSCGNECFDTAAMREIRRQREAMKVSG